MSKNTIDDVLKEWFAYLDSQEASPLVDVADLIMQSAVIRSQMGVPKIFIASTPEGENPFYDKIADLNNSPGNIKAFNGIPFETTDIPITTQVKVRVVKKWKRRNPYRLDKVRVRYKEIKVPAMLLIDTQPFGLSPEQVMFSETFRSIGEPEFKVRF